MRILASFVCAFACVIELSAQGQIRLRQSPPGGAISDPPEVTLTSPADNSINRAVDVSLAYSFTSDCDLATLYLDDVNGTTVVATDASCDGTFTSADYSGPLDYETEYFWTVKITNNGGEDTAAVWSFTTVAMGAQSVLTIGDLTCEGSFRGPQVGTGGLTTSLPMAMKVDGATRTYFLMAPNDKNVYEFDEPAELSPCGTAEASLASATVTVDWGDWPYDIQTVTGTQAGVLTYVDGALWFGFTGTYVNLPTDVNTFSKATFGTGTLDLVGCWGLDGGTGAVGNGVNGQPMGAFGVIPVPEWFRTANSITTRNLAVLGGTAASTTSHNSMGPSIEAIPDPSGTPNDCSTDHIVSPGSVLARYYQNTNLPSCSGQYLGCDVSGWTPTPPYPAQIAFTGYSIHQYAEDADPFAGHGWWNSDNGGTCNWFDTALKTGYVCMLQHTSGWMNTTVASVVSFSYPNFTITLTDFNAHDGAPPQVGDTVWIMTCVDGVGDCAEGGNMRNFCICVIDSVNVGTNTVTGHIQSPDFGSGSHSPYVGGKFFLGVEYAHGSPQPSRKDLRVQIYDPNDFSAVLAGGNLYDPVAIDDVNITHGTYTWLPQTGCPGCVIPGIPVGVDSPTILAPLVDPENNKIVLCVRNKPVGGAIRPVCVVLGVN